MDQEQEQKLIEQAKTNPEYFGPVFDKYHDAIFRYVMQRTANAEVSADIASETFFKALKNLSKYKYMGVRFSSWLYKIAGNEIYGYFRKKKYEPASYNAAIEEGGLPEPASDLNIEEEIMKAQEAVDKNEAYKKAKNAIDSLPEKYREVIILRFIEGKKVNEISEITGKREGTIKSLISRGTGKLRKFFGV